MNQAGLPTNAPVNVPGNANLPIGVVAVNVNPPTGAVHKTDTPLWRSRGYLPHFDSPQAVQHVTFHLADSLPQDALERLTDEIRCLPIERQDAERRKRVEAWIDAGHGSCLLRQPELASLTQGAFLKFDGQRYCLLAWVVMPNHAHVLFEPANQWTVAGIVASWKKFTARRINEYLKSPIGRLAFPGGHHDVNPKTGSLRAWHREYWDRYMRDERHFRITVEYIHQNPVKSRLVDKAENWRWSSAFRAIDLAEHKQNPGLPETPP